MNPSYLLYSLGNNTFFASRIFLPAFITALAMRFPQFIPLKDINETTQIESWMVNDPLICLLFLFVCVESWINKNPQMANNIGEVDKYFKFASAMLVNTTLLDPAVSSVIFEGSQSIVSEGSTELIVKESLAYANSQPEAVDNELISLGPLTLSFLVSLPTLLLAGLRKSFIEFIVTIDPNNSFGFITLASWMEEGWVVFGIVLLVVAPSIILFLTAVIFIVLWLIKRFLAAREEKQKITCDTCQEMVYPTAIKCFSCKNELKTVCDIGLLGHVLKNKITDLNSHRFKLLSVQRCTICASKLGDNNIDQTCEICKEVTLSDSIEIKGYQDFIKKRLKKVLIVSTLLGLIPIVGSITTIVYSNLALVSPYSQYVSFSKGFMARFLAKIGIWFLLLLQSIPLAGAISCPLIVLIYYYSWNSSFKKEYVI